jgi:hypothetical protein
MTSMGLDEWMDHGSGGQPVVWKKAQLFRRDIHPAGETSFHTRWEIFRTVISVSTA